ncbi:eIF-2-alpha kinase activator GCN1 [Plutella xylostella]|uniref:eIF-2-alpha kinase activator GCN1 n=1 Tax=Plutella xylostella TaxID=51655 RepID=UPI002032535B|nr:eIF-2-alpha kinase activator GCN1 [Plutella xylostella]
MILQGVAVISAHAAARPALAAPSDLRSPALMPLDHMITLLVELIIKSAKEQEQMILQGVAVISAHAAARPASAAPCDLRSPALMPLDHMITLLVELISSTTGRVQTAITAALLDTCACAASAAGMQEAQCLLAALQNPLEVVRDAALRGLLELRGALPALLEDPDHALDLTKRLMVATFDFGDDNKPSENRVLAEQLWSSLPQEQLHQWSSSPALVPALVAQAQHPAEHVQRAAAAALAALVEGRGEGGAEHVLHCLLALYRDKLPHPAEPVQRAAAAALAALVAGRGEGGAEHVLHCLLALYRDKLPLIPSKLDQFGHVTEAAVDEWGARRGAGLALTALAPQLDAAGVAVAVEFFVSEGLGDRNEAVRAEMLNAAMAMVDLHGKSKLVSAAASSPLAPQLDAAGVAVAVEFFVSEGLGDRNEAVRADMLNAAMAVVDLHGKLDAAGVAVAVEFFVSEGLGDRNEAVRADMLNAAMAMVDLHGKVSR